MLSLRRCRTLFFLQLLLLLRMPLFHLSGLLLMALLHLLLSAFIRMLSFELLMFLLLLLLEFLVIFLLLRVQLFLLFLIFLVQLRVSSIWSRGALVRRQVLRMPRITRTRYIVSPCVPALRISTPSIPARRIVNRACLSRRLHSAFVKRSWSWSSGNRWLTVVYGSP